MSVQDTQSDPGPTVRPDISATILASMGKMGPIDTVPRDASNRYVFESEGYPLTLEVASNGCHGTLGPGCPG